MKDGRLRLIINNIIFIVLIALFFTKNIEAETEKAEAEVIGVNPEMGFFIVSAGESNGVEIGDSLKIFANNNEIGEGQIIEVRERVSAAEPTGPSNIIVKEGDKVKVYPPKRQRSEWTPLFGIKRQYETQKGSYEPIVKSVRSNELFSIDIGSEPKRIYPFIFQVLRNKGYAITYSNRFAGVINASKDIGLSLPAELWADLKAAIDHKVLLTVNIKGTDSASSLSFNAFLEHFQKGKRVEGFIGQGSGFYRELIDIAGEIKELAEAKIKVE